MGRQPDGSGRRSRRARGFAARCATRRLHPAPLDRLPGQDARHAQGRHHRGDAARRYHPSRDPGTRDQTGAYVIVSSKGSTSDIALRNRRDVLREALDGVANAGQLHTDFYDRTRLSTWVRRHPGLITWVKERVGRALVGWRSYGLWSGAAEGVDAEYLLDDKLGLHLGSHRHARAIGGPRHRRSRDEVAQAGKIVRLVGLSGVGNSRLVQALFDSRIGSRPLPPSLAVYTNLSDNPDPQPTGLASDLIANRTRAVLIVDNCPPDLHRRLSDLCSGPTSTVSVITVEYDVRDDQPENTHVVTLGTASPELIEKLVRRRYPHVSEVDARSIAEASGGNAGLLSPSPRRSSARTQSLACRTTSFFSGSSSSGKIRTMPCSSRPKRARSFTPSKARLGGGSVRAPASGPPGRSSCRGDLPSCRRLLRRDLAQQRGVWRAVLPHAIANRLAARALEDTPYDLIDEQLIAGGTERLARSFSRRLRSCTTTPGPSHRREMARARWPPG